MDPITNILDGNSAAEDDSIIKVWWMSRFLGVDPDQLQLLPEHLHQVVQVQLHVARDHHVVLAPGQPVHFLQGYPVNLVVDVDALHVDSGAKDGVDELVRSGVLPKQNLSIVDLVFMQDQADSFLVHVGQWYC